jgi:hypothetical protein
MTPASIFILCCFVIATSVLLTYNGPYLRLEAERSAAAAATTLSTERSAATTTSSTDT